MSDHICPPNFGSPRPRAPPPAAPSSPAPSSSGAKSYTHCTVNLHYAATEHIHRVDVASSVTPLAAKCPRPPRGCGSISARRETRAAEWWPSARAALYVCPQKVRPNGHTLLPSLNTWFLTIFLIGDQRSGYVD
ncbi:unnamed protein product, partial [Iphiclides podalirius]